MLFNSRIAKSIRSFNYICYNFAFLKYLSKYNQVVTSFLSQYFNSLEFHMSGLSPLSQYAKQRDKNSDKEQRKEIFFLCGTEKL
jgi:hypothetical protein